MKKIILLIIVLSSINLQSQNCILDTLEINTQSELNNFPENYSDCTHILGTIYIHSADIVDLTPLSQVTAIDGNLLIKGCNITNLNGLHNIVNVGGMLEVRSCYALATVNMESLTTIGGSLEIRNNDLLQSLWGMENLESVGGDAEIKGCDALLNVNLPNLQEVDGDFKISWNHMLNSLSGMESLTTIHGDFKINGNDLLQDINGISNLRVIGGAFSLSSGLEHFYIDDLLLDSVGDVRIHAPIDNLEFMSNVSGFNGYIYLNGTKLENLEGLEQINYCTDLDLRRNHELVSLSGIENLTTIENGLDIYRNNALLNIDGLSGLDSLGGPLMLINNTALLNVDGFQNLSGFSSILCLNSNHSLQDITGFSNLVDPIGLEILNCSQLTSLTGLENISEIPGILQIENNIELNMCGIPAICERLALDSTNVIINNNGSACDEIADFCVSGISSYESTKIQIYPNPASDHVNLSRYISGEIEVFNSMGVLMYTTPLTGDRFDVSMLPAGIYQVQLYEHGKTQAFKIVKE